MSAFNAIARLETMVCKACGRSVAAAELSLSGSGTCLRCSLDGHGHAAHDLCQALIERLHHRRRLGERLGNRRAIDFPVGLDHDFKQIIDGLRTYVIEVRITVGIDRFGQRRVAEGYLRRFGPTDRQSVEYDLYAGSAGLYATVAGTQARSVIEDNEFRHVERIEIIDHQLIGDRGPVTVWQASLGQMETYLLNQNVRDKHERTRAVWFAVHAVTVALIWTSLLVPVIVHTLHGTPWLAVGWWLTFFFVGVATGTSLGAWQPPPDLRLIWRTDHQ